MTEGKQDVFDKDYKEGAAFTLLACLCTDSAIVTPCPCCLVSGKYCCMELWCSSS